MPLFRKQSAAEVTSLAPHDSKARLLSGRDSQGFMAKPCTPHLIAQRVQPGRPLAPPAGGAIPKPAAAKTKLPRPGAKTGGRGWSGGARRRSGAAAKGRWSKPPLPWLPAARPANGATAAEWPRRSQPPPLQKNGMAGACRRGRPPPLPRETAQQGHRGAQRNPAAGAQAFAPSARRHLRSGGGGRG